MNIPKTTNLSPSEVAFTLNPDLPVLTHSRSMQAESGITPHSHPRGQLLWAEYGILRLWSEQAIHVVPSTHAIWIPGGLLHQASCETNAHLRNLYVDPSYTVRQQDKLVVMLEITPLMRELILKLTKEENQLAEDKFQRLGAVVLDELDSLLSYDIHIPSGNDPRLRRLITHLVNNPYQTQTLPELAKQAGASVRTMERLFKAETGMTFRQWRSRFRLMNSLDKLGQGVSSSSVAHELGYKSVSSFTAAFKMLFGKTPSQYAGGGKQGSNH